MPHEFCFLLIDPNYPKKGTRGSDFVVPCSAHTDENLHVIIVQTYKSLAVIDMTQLIGFIESSFFRGHFGFLFH